MARVSEMWHRLVKRLTGKKQERWSSYLERHDYYADPGEFGSYGKFPRLPYSLTDLLSDRLAKGTGIRAFVCRHGSSAHWLVKNGIDVTLGRDCHSKHAYAGITYLPEWKNYAGKDFDLLLLDSHQMMGAGEILLPHLSPRGILIIAHLGLGKYSMNSEAVRISEHLRSKLKDENWKSLRFSNPAPGIGELTAEVWYRPENLLNL